MGWESGLQVLATVLGIIVLLAGIVLFIGGSYNKARIQSLRDDNDDLRARLGDASKEREHTKVKSEALEEKVSALKRENDVLRDMVTQRANVAELRSLLEEQHQQSMTAWERIANALERRQNE